MSDKRVRHPSYPSLQAGLSDPPPPEVLSQSDIAKASDRDLIVRAYNLQAWSVHKVIRLDERVSDFFTTLISFDVRLREIEAWKADHLEDYRKMSGRLDEAIDIAMRTKIVTDSLVRAVNESPAIRNVETTGRYSQDELDREMTKAAERLARDQALEIAKKRIEELEAANKKRTSWYGWGTRKVVGPVLGAIGTGIVIAITWAAASCYHHAPVLGHPPAETLPTP